MDFKEKGRGMKLKSKYVIVRTMVLIDIMKEFILLF
jgi:hypothetical protein